MSKVPDSIKQELAALIGISDDQIDYSDIPETTAKDWENATRGQFYRPVKEQTTVRIDADVLAWLKTQGKGYQSRMNAILRTAMLNSLKTTNKESIKKTKNKPTKNKIKKAG